MIHISSKRQERIEKLSMMLARLYAHEGQAVPGCACTGLSCGIRGCSLFWTGLLDMDKVEMDRMLSLYTVAKM